MNGKETQLRFWRALAVLFFLNMALAAFDIGHNLSDLGVEFSIRTFWWPVVLGICFVSITGILWVWTPWFPIITSDFVGFHWETDSKKRVFLIAMFLFITLGFSAWVNFRGHLVLDSYFVRLFFYQVVALIGGILLKFLTQDESWPLVFAGSLLMTAAIYRAMTFVPGISSSPFSMGWSEGSRYYYGSLFFSKSLYNMTIPLSPWHPSRYILLSLPFLVPGLPIWFHRFWQVLLWIGLAVWAGISFSRRFKINNILVFLSFTSWVFLFLHLGPVYYHLLVCAILIFSGVDFTKPRKTFLILLLASVWAGLSRINWVPVPFFMVVTLYLLEIPWNPSQKIWRYLARPVAWGLGIVLALFSYIAYIQLSGNAASKFGSSFTSDLLWNRLWPNPTFQLGILPGTVLISIPLWAILVARLRNRIASCHSIKWLTYAGILSILFFGGLVVSVKIGGGSNLHNMDAFFVLIMMIAGYLYWDRVVYDRDLHPSVREKSLPGWITAAAIIIPILLTLGSGNVNEPPDLSRDQNDLQLLSQIMTEITKSGGEVLFISERQLQVFGLVPAVPFVPDYEKIELMEMAMAGNQAYLQKFNEDISRKRFALIISDPIRMDNKDETEAFSEEHNVWVNNVVHPLVEMYQYFPLGGRRNIIILTPRQ